MRTTSLFALFLGVYLLGSSFRVDTIDTAVRLEVARSLAHRGAFDLPRLQLHTEFGVIGAFPGEGGRYFSVYGMGQSLLMVPFVLIGGAWDAQLITLINPIATALACALLFPIGLMLGFSRAAARRAALAAGFCTLAWPHSKLTFEAPLEMTCLIVALYFTLRRRRFDLCYAGAAAGFALLTRPTAVWLLPGLGWMLWRDRRDLGRRVADFAAGLAPFIAAALMYNAHRWGSPLASGYTYTEHRYFDLVPRGLVGFLLSPGRGFFWFSPILILSPWGWQRLKERRRGLGEAMLITSAAYLLFFGFSTVWHGDWTWGPRHLLPLVPLGILALLPLLEPGELEPRLLRGVWTASLLIQLVGVLGSYDVYYVRTRRPSAGMTVDHFSSSAAQIPVQARLVGESLIDLPASIREMNPVVNHDVYQCRVDTSNPDRPRLLMNPTPWPLPNLWWFYFPLAGIPAWFGLALFFGCVGLIVWGGRAVAAERATS
jgi:hypothetical protein